MYSVKREEIEAAALVAFKVALQATIVKHGELDALERSGWVEQCPDENFWRFTNRMFPGIEVRWTPDIEPWGVTY